jgi:predicted unusual protein kinase regulating ubiquinone biosynthesis (AarF/ABC1/UbiB family)
MILNILKQLPKFKILALNFKKIISEELNLLNEYKAFNKLSSIERLRNSDYFLFPEILDVSISTIQREFIKGNTIGKLLETKNINKQLLNKIKKLHCLTIQCAFYDNLIFSDFHLGNIIYNQDLDKLVIIDAGQFTKVLEEDLTLFMWLIVDLVSKKKYIHDIFINKLKTFTKSNLEYDIEEYNKAYQMSIDKSIYFIMDLLEKTGYKLPSSFVACSKMLDLIQSQITLLNLEDVYFIDEIKKILSSKITYYDYISIAQYYMSNFGK